MRAPAAEVIRILDEWLVVTRASGTSGRAELIDSILSRPIPPNEVVHDVIRVFDDTAIVVDRFGTGLRSQVMWCGSPSTRGSLAGDRGDVYAGGTSHDLTGRLDSLAFCVYQTLALRSSK
jgi:hypothetical protein